jgi:hypothetical protein
VPPAAKPPTAAKPLEVQPSSPSSHYLGYPSKLTRSSDGATSRATTVNWKEPTCLHEAVTAENKARARVVALPTRAGEARASIATDAFEVRETTLLKAKAVRQVEVKMAGSYKFQVKAEVGRAGYALAEAKLAMRVEKREAASGAWQKAEEKDIASCRKVAGQEAIGRQVGSPADNPHYGGFECAAKKTKVEPGEMYRVRLEVSTACQGGGECQAEANAYDGDLGAWWDEIEVESW